MNIPISISLLLTPLSCIFEIIFLNCRKKQQHLKALLYKGLAALCFCTVGLLLTLYKGRGFYITAGLFLGLLGDELLALRKIRPCRHDLFFSAGAVAFCLGHGCYMAALLKAQTGLLPGGVPLFLILTALSEIFAHKAGFSKGKMHLPGLFYIAIEAFMCALALVSLGNQPGIGTLLFGLGGLSFLISDNLLCAYSFGRLKTPAVDTWLHITYLAAQLLIAWSILWG